MDKKSINRIMHKESLKIKTKHMKKYIYLLALLVSTVVFSQDITRHLGEFTSLKVYDGLNITLVKSDKNNAVISGEYASDVILVNKNGVLKVKLKLPKLYRGSNTSVALYYTDLSKIIAYGGAHVKSKGTLKGFDASLTAKQGSVIRIAVNVKRLSVRVATGAVIETSGKANHQFVIINTGGEYQAIKCKTTETNITVNTGGIADIYTTDAVEATVKAGGFIKVYGNPKHLGSTKVLGGSIEIVGNKNP